MNNNRKFAVFFAAVILVVLPATLYISSLNTQKVFVFTWSEEEQDIVNGTLRIEISFQWTNESLSVIAKINHRQDFGLLLGLVFDKNGNGKIDYWSSDEPYMFYRINRIVHHGAFLLETNQLMPRGNWERSSYHNCTFIEGEGYLYNISIPKGELAEVKANTVMIYYEGGVYYEPLAGPRMSDWVYVFAEGWQ